MQSRDIIISNESIFRTNFRDITEGEGQVYSYSNNGLCMETTQLDKTCNFSYFFNEGEMSYETQFKCLPADYSNYYGYLSLVLDNNVKVMFCSCHFLYSGYTGNPLLMHAYNNNKRYTISVVVSSASDADKFTDIEYIEDNGSYLGQPIHLKFTKISNTQIQVGYSFGTNGNKNILCPVPAFNKLVRVEHALTDGFFNAGSYDTNSLALIYKTTVETNTAPVITVDSANLGAKYTAFNVPYKVTDKEYDSVIVTEKVDDTIIRTLTNNNLGVDLGVDVSSKIFEKLSYGQHFVYIEAKDAYSSKQTVVLFEKVNVAPIILGADSDLGESTSPPPAFSFSVKDANLEDTLTVETKLDNITVNIILNATRNKNYEVSLISSSIDWSAVTVGRHAFITTVTDGHGLQAVGTHTFTKTNTSPTISGTDSDLGNIIEPPKISFSVNDVNLEDVLAVKVRVDSTLISTISGAERGKIYEIDLAPKWSVITAKNHVLSISVKDNSYAQTYRNYIFTKTNTPPTISGTDTDLGSITNPPKVSFSVNDVNLEDVLTIEAKLDNTVINTFANAERNKDYTIDLNTNWSTVTAGAHTLVVTVKDSSNAQAIRSHTFTKINTPPTISGTDSDLGSVTEPPKITYSVNSLNSGYILTIETKFDNVLINTISNAERNKDYIIDLNTNWSTVRAGKHTVLIFVKDNNNSQTTRTYTFTKMFTALKEFDVPKNIYSKDMIDTLRKKTNELRVLNNIPEYIWEEKYIMRGITPIKSSHWNEIEKAILEVYTLTNTKLINDNTATELKLSLINGVDSIVQKHKSTVDNIILALQNK